MASARPTDLNVTPTRLGGSRGAARAPILGIALVLVAVVTAGVLGDQPAVPQPEAGAVSGGRIVDAAVIGEATIQEALGEAAAREPAGALLPTMAMRLEQPRVKFGPPPWAYNGRVAAPRSTRLRVLGWQVDPYQT
jgi:hypothetical protein